MTDTEWSYVAGFFDGEGCISIYPQHSGSHMHTMAVSIGQVDRRPLDWIASRFGGAVSKRKPRGGNRQQQHQWSMTGARASAFLKGVQPYLIVKKDQAETAIYFQDVLKNRANGVDHLMERLANMRLKQQKIVDRSVGVTF